MHISITLSRTVLAFQFVLLPTLGWLVSLLPAPLFCSEWRTFCICSALFNHWSLVCCVFQWLSWDNEEQILSASDVSNHCIWAVHRSCFACWGQLKNGSAIYKDFWVLGDSLKLYFVALLRHLILEVYTKTVRKAKYVVWGKTVST